MIIEAIHPGVYIKNELNSLQMSVREFSKRTGISEKQLSLLISGDANLTLDIAEKLSKFFGNLMLKTLVHPANAYDGTVVIPVGNTIFPSAELFIMLNELQLLKA